MYTLIVVIYHMTGTQRVEHIKTTVESHEICHKMGEDAKNSNKIDQVEYICIHNKN